MTAAELLNFVFSCAISDREALAFGCDANDPMRAEALADARKFKALRDKLLPLKTPGSMKEWLAANKDQFESIDLLSVEGRKRLREISEQGKL